jgi:hypothetical protein
MGVGVRLSAKAIPALGLLVLSVGAQLGQVDYRVLAQHTLAFPHASLVGVIASLVGLAVGLVTISALLGVLPTAGLGGRLRQRFNRSD